MARACRSASNRATTSRVSMPGLMIFSATLRRTGSRLRRHVHDAHAAFANLLQQLVGTDLGAGEFGDEREVDGGGNARDRRFKKTVALRHEHAGAGLDPFAQRGLAADLVEVCVTRLLRRRYLEQRLENGFFVSRVSCASRQSSAMDACRVPYISMRDLARNSLNENSQNSRTNVHGRDADWSSSAIWTRSQALA